MMHKDWHSIEEVPYCFFRSSIKFPGHMDVNDLNPILSENTRPVAAIKSLRFALFTQPFIQVQIKENIKAPRHWPLCGEITGDRSVNSLHKRPVNAENGSIWWRHHAPDFCCKGLSRHLRIFYGNSEMWWTAYQGPVSLRLMTSQFKDIVTHTQK